MVSKGVKPICLHAVWLKPSPITTQVTWYEKLAHQYEKAGTVDLEISYWNSIGRKCPRILLFALLLFE